MIEFANDKVFQQIDGLKTSYKTILLKKFKSNPPLVTINLLSNITDTSPKVTIQITIRLHNNYNPPVGNNNLMPLLLLQFFPCFIYPVNMTQ